jgi:hypothetical protein
MEGRITLYSNTGVALAEVQGTAPRGWLLNKFGQAKIRLPLSEFKSADYPSARLDERHVQIGNLVLVEHDRVGDWAGVITTPITDDVMSGEKELTAYTAEWLLLFRIAPRGRIVGTRGQVFQQLIQFANDVPGPRFGVGMIYGGGGNVKPFRPGRHPSIYDSIMGKMSGERAGHDWGLTHAFTEDGRLYFLGNWYGTRGEYRPNRALIEGHNMRVPSGAALAVEGEIINEIRIIGEKERPQQSGGKPGVTQRDTASIEQYGIFQKKRGYEETDLAEIGDYGTTILNEQAQPRRRFIVEALDVNNTFDWLQLGDVIPLKLYRAGFSGGQLGIDTDLRILGRAFDETEGYLKLAVEESVL